MKAEPAAGGDAKPVLANAKIMPKPEAGEGSADATVDTPVPDEAMPADPNADMGMGMMAGVPGAGHKGPAKPVEIKYEPTVWGRYAKLLLSSTEFVFIN